MASSETSENGNGNVYCLTMPLHNLIIYLYSASAPSKSAEGVTRERRHRRQIIFSTIARMYSRNDNSVARLNVKPARRAMSINNVGNSIVSA